MVDEDDTDPPQRTVWLEAENPPDQVEAVLTEMREQPAVIEVSVDRAMLSAD